jgi:hypothetical protein
MRKWLFIAAAALAALSCSREKEPDLVSMEPEGKVEVTFTVAGDQMVTKDLGEAHQLETMHVAVFGGSGYLKEYIPATLVSTGTYEYHYYDANHDERVNVVPEFTFTVQITLSNSSRRVHFIGNGPSSIPFGRDYEVLPTLLGEKETGYWQMILLDRISALQDGDGDYLTPDGNGGTRKRQQGEPYLPSTELTQAFSHVPLIRSWAKIELSAKPADQSNFTPISFAVTNVPKHGALVPYGGVKGFITNYKDLSFEDLRSDEYNYGGNLPASVEFDSYLPSASDFVNFTGGVKRYAENAPADNEDYAAYLYERPVPDANIPPSYVIVYGLYNNPEDTSLTDEERAAGGVYCFYKVDLMAGTEYYPVLRNFKYIVRIDKISAKGHPTPDAAANAAGSADVSADINASSLPDISDGTRRMAIQPWMAKTFINAQAKQKQLYVTFYNDINGSNPVPNLTPAADGCVSYELIPATAGIVKEVEIGEASSDPTHSDYGWRPISFAIASPEEAAGRSQTLRIICKVDPNDPQENPLYRDVVISLLPIQPMRVNCENSRVLLVTGESQRVDVDIPDGLVESMFPLNFLIEAQNLTLTPDTSVDGNDLPVISETSIIGNYPSFHFQRTLEWSEYKTLPAKLDYEDDTRWRTFSSYFKTNCEKSATAIYVANEYFYTANTSFSNYSSFREPKFTTPIPRSMYASVNVSAQLMVDQQPYLPVYLMLQGLQPAAGSGITWDDNKSMYKYTPTSSTMNFLLETRVKTGDVSVTMVSEDASYEECVLTPWHFREAKVMDMASPSGSSHTGGTYANVVNGHVNSEADKLLFIGYFTDAAAPRPQTTIKDLSGVVSEDGKTTWNDAGPLSGTAQNLYREKWLKTQAGIDPVSLTLSAVGYVEESISAPRFRGHLYSADYRYANDWNGLVNNLYSQEDQTYDYRSQKTAKVNDYPYLETCNIVLDITGNMPIQAHGSTTTDGIVLPAGGHYVIEVNILSNNQDVSLFYNQLFYYVDNGTVLKPRSVDPHPDGSIYYGYQGNNHEYIWSAPVGEPGGKLVIDAPAGRDVVITRLISKGFHGVLNSTGSIGGGDVGFDGDLENGGE